MTVRNIRAAELCLNCKNIKTDIDRVRNGKSYSQINDQDRSRIYNRIKHGRTLAVGPFNYLGKSK